MQKDTFKMNAQDVFFADRGKGLSGPDVQSTIEDLYFRAILDGSNIGVISTSDYGAIGDGESDDTQALRNALSNGKYPVIIPYGTYRITDQILVNVPIIGIGNPVILSDFPGSLEDGILHFESLSNVYVSNIEIDGRGNDHRGLSVTDSKNIIIDNVFIHDIQKIGIYISNSSNGIVRNCQIDRAMIGQGDGMMGSIRIDNNSEFIRVEHCLITNSHGKGIAFVNANHCVINDCHVKECESDGFYFGLDSFSCHAINSSVKTSLSQATKISRNASFCSITHCHIVTSNPSPGSAGVRIQGAHHCRISDNYIESLGGNAITLSYHDITKTNPNNTIIENNIIRTLDTVVCVNVTTSDNAEEPIQNVSVINNVFQSNGRQILFTDNNKDIIVKGNRTHPDYYPNLPPSIRNTENLVLKDNDFQGRNITLYNNTFMERKTEITVQADGSSNTVSWDHFLVRLPSYVSVTPRNQAAKGFSYVEANETQIIIHYETPPNGELKFYWEATAKPVESIIEE